MPSRLRTLYGAERSACIHERRAAMREKVRALLRQCITLGRLSTHEAQAFLIRAIEDVAGADAQTIKDRGDQVTREQGGLP